MPNQILVMMTNILQIPMSRTLKKECLHDLYNYKRFAKLTKIYLNSQHRYENITITIERNERYTPGEREL